MVLAAERLRKIDAELTRRFPDEVVSRIAATLPRFVSQEAHANFARSIRDWAGGVMSAQDIRARGNEFRRTKSTRSRLQKAAKELLAAYDDLDPVSQMLLALRIEGREGVFELPSDVIQDYLSAVRRGIECIAGAAQDDGTPRRGRPKDAVRHMAVLALATIYVETTGQRPTLRRDPYTDRYYGPFRKFCIAALTPIQGKSRAETGIDALITRILYVRK